MLTHQTQNMPKRAVDQVAGFSSNPKFGAKTLPVLNVRKCFLTHRPNGVE